MAGTYNPADLPDSDEEWERQPGGTADSDLAEAAAAVCALLTEAGIAHAIIGGVGMKMKGSDRPTQDVDIAIEKGTTIQQVQLAVSSSPCIRLPKFADVVYRILVRVSSGIEVQVDLKLATHAGAPVSLVGQREMRVFQGRTLPTLTPFAAFRSKLNVHASRELESDFEDLLYLLQNYGDVIKANASELDKSDLSVFIEKLNPSTREAISQFLTPGD